MKRVFTHKARIVFTFPFSYELKDKVKSLFGGGVVEFNKIKTHPNKWSIATKAIDTTGKIEEFLQFTSTEGFEVEPEILKRLEEQKSEFAVLKELSSASESDFSIDLENLLLTPRPYQKVGIKYMVQTKTCLNGDEMRLGKTMQTLSSVEYLNAYPCLVVCKSGLMYNWKSEIEKTLAGKSVYVCDKVKKGLQSGYDFVTVNPEKLDKMSDALSGYGFKSIAYDEAHNIGSRNTKKFAALMRVAEDVDIKYALTGTPVKNRALELVSILEFLGRLSEFGGKWKFINDFYHTSHDGFGFRIGEAKNLDILHEKLRSRCMVRRTKKDVLNEIPQKTFITVEVPISNRSAYDALASEVRVLTTKARKDITYKAEKNGKIFELRRVTGVGKVEAICDWVEDFLATGEPLVLFAHHIDVQQGILQRFPDAARILGSESNLKVRKENEDRFQRGDTNLIVCSFIEGITLDRANTVGVCELGWVPAVLDQAIARIEAVGKTEPSTIYSFLAIDTIDIKLSGMLQNKGAESDMVTSGKENDDSYVNSLLEGDFV